MHRGVRSLARFGGEDPFCLIQFLDFEKFRHGPLKRYVGVYGIMDLKRLWTTKRSPSTSKIPWITSTLPIDVVYYLVCLIRPSVWTSGLSINELQGCPKCEYSFLSLSLTEDYIGWTHICVRYYANAEVLSSWNGIQRGCLWVVADHIFSLFAVLLDSPSRSLSVSTVALGPMFIGRYLRVEGFLSHCR